MTNVTSGAEAAKPSGAHEIIPQFLLGLVLLDV
jgi:hypothetical protein